MRLAAKFTLALLLGITLVLAVQASLHFRRVVELHERETRDDVSILARALGGAVSEIWTSSGRQRAEEYVSAADARRAQTRIRMRDAAAYRQQPARPDVPLDQLTGPTAPQRHGEQLVSLVPVRIGSQTPAFIELRRSLTHFQEYRAGILWTQIGTTVALAIVCAAIVLGLGVWFIGRPVQRLIAQARRVAAGDFSAAADVRQRDELGHLARELTSMTEQLGRAREELDHQRRDRTTLLEQLRHADRLSTVGKLASGIAHELGTPLNVVSGRAAMIADGEATRREMAEHAQIIRKQTERMAQFIRELLDFSRRRTVSRFQTDLTEVIDKATTLLEPIADDRSVEIATELTGPLQAAIDVDKTLQVLTNLMTNGVQAMPAGGTLTVGARTEHVDTPANDHAAAGEYVVLYVRDEGSGIDRADLEHIFEPFFTTKRSGRGTGLGLYVCHGIVREQGGWIEVESEVDRGSTFLVYLPRHDPARSES